MSPEPRRLTSREEVARLRAALNAEDYETAAWIVRQVLIEGGPQRVAETIRRAQQGDR
ncbi:hypothetical protein ABZ820_41840 [Streptomyces diacarni]|uniref:hypothetical protein n=1 Tax=Streptomyces diacarni TaxID=2800381 RepID=UPI00340F7F69